MEFKAADLKPAQPNTGLNFVREKAKKQSPMRLRRTELEQEQEDETVCDLDPGLGFRSSHQKFQTLKNISLTAEEERDAYLAQQPGWFAQMWGEFQRFIGNR